MAILSIIVLGVVYITLDANERINRKVREAEGWI